MRTPDETGVAASVPVSLTPAATGTPRLDGPTPEIPALAVPVLAIPVLVIPVLVIPVTEDGA